jgi:hypothetical protein
MQGKRTIAKALVRRKIMGLLTVLVIVFGLGMAADTKVGQQTAANSDQELVKDEKLRQELQRRMEADQEARKPMFALMQKYKGVDPEEIKKKNELPEVKRMNEIDHENTERMKQIVKEFGWPGKSLVGTDGANAAWLLVQHADHDRAFQKQCLELLQDGVKKAEATGEQLAYLTDRVRLGERKKQVYGTQVQLVDGKFRPYPIENEAEVDKRRKDVGLSPLADYLKFTQSFFEQSTKSNSGSK